MKLRLLLPITSGVLIAIALISGACGDDDEKDSGGDGATDAATDGAGESSLGTYMAQVDEIQDGVTEATDAIGDRSEQAFGDPARARAALTAAVDVGESAVASLEDLSPPESAQAAHEELIAADENLVAEAQSFADRLSGVEAGAEFDQITAEAEAPDSELSRAIERMRQACQEMVDLAAANDLTLDLSCPAEQ
jgi:ABC-type transporter Mla subunit MlaD